jgi:hypothetical protein
MVSRAFWFCSSLPVRRRVPSNSALNRTHLSAASRAQARRLVKRWAARDTVGCMSCMNRNRRAHCERSNLCEHLAWLARAPHHGGPAGLKGRCPSAASVEGEPSPPARLDWAAGHGRAAAVVRLEDGRDFRIGNASSRGARPQCLKTRERRVRRPSNSSLNRTHLSAASRAQARRLVQR